MSLFLNLAGKLESSSADAVNKIIDAIKQDKAVSVNFTSGDFYTLILNRSEGGKYSLQFSDCSIKIAIENNLDKEILDSFEDN
jgi:hypothetical protein